MPSSQLLLFLVLFFIGVCFHTATGFTSVTWLPRTKLTRFLSDIPQPDSETKTKKKDQPTGTIITTNKKNKHSKSPNKDDDDDETPPNSLSCIQPTSDSSISIPLPPPPEDIFVLTGDLLSLAVYGFSDHFFSRDVMEATVKAADSPSKLSALLSSMTTSSTTVNSEYLLSTPVWLDSNSPHQAHILQLTVHDQIVSNYSPLLQTTGGAFTVLASCWLLAGWFHHAFAYRNTIDCRTEKALTVTALSWITCSVLVLTSTATCSILMTAMAGNYVGDAIIQIPRGDLNFIVDSLSVLTMWRFMASWLLGTGGGGNDTD